MPLLKSLRIEGLETQNNVFLAPLAGIGDNSYRILGRRFGAGLTFSEMVSAHGITKRNRRTMDLLLTTPIERPIGIQLFGSDPEIMEQAVLSCADYPMDLIDINSGCSVRKVLRTGAGAGLLDDPAHFFRVVKACVAVSSRPVSVKLRLGLSEDRINVVETSLAAQEAGASLLTLHPRTAEMGYGGSARWEYIGLVKQRLRIPVCGNGDIRTPEDAIRMVRETACDAVMIGRAAIGNPWLIDATIHAFESFPEPPGLSEPSVRDRVSLALEHLELVISFKGEERAVREMRRHIYRYIRGIHDAAKLREVLFRLRTAGELRSHLQSLVNGSCLR
jgi:nifR3 family TIM-barrel protein